MMLRESLSLCKNFVVKCHEVAKVFWLVDYVMEMTARSPVHMANIDCLSICSCCCWWLRGWGGLI